MPQNNPLVGKPTPPEIQKVGDKFPALRPYLDKVVVQYQKNPKKDDRQVEFYAPWESDNPNPGKITITPFRRELTKGDALTNTVAGELLHHIGGFDPTSRKPVNPDYWKLKQAVIDARTQPQKDLDRRIYAQEQKKGEDRPFNDWLNQSRADEYVMGYVTPDKTDEWRKNGFYKDPKMQQAVSGLQDYLTKEPEVSAPAPTPPAPASPPAGIAPPTNMNPMGGPPIVSPPAQQTAPVHPHVVAHQALEQVRTFSQNLP